MLTTVAADSLPIDAGDAIGLDAEVTGLICLIGLLAALIMSSKEIHGELPEICAAGKVAPADAGIFVSLHIILAQRFIQSECCGGPTTFWAGKHAITRGWCMECCPCKISMLMHFVVEMRSFARSLAPSLHIYEQSEPTMQSAKP